MLSTPDLTHLTKEDYKYIYEPAEDTFILLDALEEDADFLKKINPRICLEIGSGSGCVSAFLGQIIHPSSCLYICTDINSRACTCTMATGDKNKIPLNVIRASLADPVKGRLSHGVDILLFNPPYVETDMDELYSGQGDSDVKAAWAGGSQGMEVTNHVLDIVGDILSDDGAFYLIAVSTNDVPAIRSKLLQEQQLESEIILQRRAGREHLFVIKFTRKRIS